MTPEERAEKLVEALSEHINVTPTVRAIAAAIREAVAEERRICLALCHCDGCHLGEFPCAGCLTARRIRSLGDSK